MALSPGHPSTQQGAHSPWGIVQVAEEVHSFGEATETRDMGSETQALKAVL